MPPSSAGVAGPADSMQFIKDVYWMLQPAKVQRRLLARGRAEPAWRHHSCAPQAHSGELHTTSVCGSGPCRHQFQLGHMAHGQRDELPPRFAGGRCTCLADKSRMLSHVRQANKSSGGLCVPAGDAPGCAPALKRRPGLMFSLRSASRPHLRRSSAGSRPLRAARCSRHGDA